MSFWVQGYGFIRFRVQVYTVERSGFMEFV